MGSFSDAAFKTKLRDLNSTQQSIQTISLWAIHHRKHAARIVQLWHDEFRSATEPTRKLTLLYFANDVIQNGRKKGPEFQTEFRLVLVEALEDATRVSRKFNDDKTQRGVGRLVQVWRERTIFDDAFLTKLDQAITNPSATPVDKSPQATSSSSSGATNLSPNGFNLNQTQINVKRVAIDPADFQAFVKKSKGSDGKEEPVYSDEEEYDELPPPNPDEEPPKFESLLALIQKLQNPPSSNADVRSKIAALPSIITDVEGIEKLTDKNEISRLSEVSREGLTMVQEYNKELQQELQDRQALAAELAKQLAHHRKVIQQKEKLQEKLRQQVDDCRTFRERLAIHVASLPDLTTIAPVFSSTSFNRSGSASPDKVKSVSNGTSAPFSRTTFPLK